MVLRTFKTRKSTLAMAGELGLITGISGLIGFRILAVALESGYRVRGVIRQQAQADTIRAARSIQPYQGNLEFVVVPDMLRDGAYDDVLDGVSYILHSASPVPRGSEIHGDLEAAFIAPAVKGTTGILQSALKQPSIKRVVITSSISAIVPLHELLEHDSPETFNGKLKLSPTASRITNTLSNPENSTIFPIPSGPHSNPYAAYSASKVHALHATHAFVTTQKPSFAVINMIPPAVIGPNELASSPRHILDGSNAFAFAQILGHNVTVPIPGNSVSIDDCARIHVRALDPDIAVAGVENFVLAAGGVEGIVWSDALGIVGRNFPQAVREGVLPLGGQQPTMKIRLDARRTEEVFGVEWEGFEKQVVALTGHYLELVEKETEKGREKQGLADAKI